MRIYNQDIGMEFCIEKCSMLIMKSGKQLMTGGMERPNQEKIRTLGEKETYKYFIKLEASSSDERKKIRKVHLRRTRKLLETKLESRNLIKGINIWAVPLIRCSASFLKWARKQKTHDDA